LEFTLYAQSISELLPDLQKNGNNIFGIDPIRFDKSVKTTLVRSQDHAMLDGQEVDAINTPEKNLIVINRSRWEKDTPTQKLTLALHEMLGILKITDVEYQITGQFFEKYGPMITSQGKAIESCAINGNYTLTDRLNVLVAEANIRQFHALDPNFNFLDFLLDASILSKTLNADAEQSVTKMGYMDILNKSLSETGVSADSQYITILVDRAAHLTGMVMKTRSSSTKISGENYEPLNHLSHSTNKQSWNGYILSVSIDVSCRAK